MDLRPIFQASYHSLCTPYGEGAVTSYTGIRNDHVYFQCLTSGKVWDSRSHQGWQRQKTLIEQPNICPDPQLSACAPDWLQLTFGMTYTLSCIIYIPERARPFLVMLVFMGFEGKFSHGELLFKTLCLLSSPSKNIQAYQNIKQIICWFSVSTMFKV